MSGADDLYTRSDFLRRSGLAVAGVAAGTSLVSATSAAARVARSNAAVSTTLRFIGWQGYDGTPASTFPILSQWEQQNGISLSTAYIDTNEDIITKMQNVTFGIV